MRGIKPVVSSGKFVQKYYDAYHNYWQVLLLYQHHTKWYISTNKCFSTIQVRSKILVSALASYKFVHKY